jgi:hypothetical protein
MAATSFLAEPASVARRKRLRLAPAIATVAAAAVIWLGGAAPAHAAPMEYDLIDGLATVGNDSLSFADIIQFNGYFTFDPATVPEPIESDVSITIYFDTPFSSTYTQMAAAETEPNVVFATGGADVGNDTLILEFEYNFGAVLPVDPDIGPYNPLIAVMIETPDGTAYDSEGTVLGDAVPVAEPTSLLLFGGLALFRFAGSARRRGAAVAS